MPSSNEDCSVRTAANHSICPPNTDSDTGPGCVHRPVSYHDPPGGSSLPDRKKSKRERKRSRSSVSGMSLSLTALSMSAELGASTSGPCSRQRTFTRTHATSMLTNISNLTSTTNTLPQPPQFTFDPVQSDVLARRCNVIAAEDLNPFSLTPHLDSVMFPSLTSAIDAVLEEDRSLKDIVIEIDPLGCAVLPPSEYTLSLESECKLHYSFWDSYNQTQFCVPVDLALRLDPSRGALYDFYPLALPPISQIAVRFSTVTFQTRFSRLVPKPAQVNTVVHPNQSYITTYQGAAVNSPDAPHQKLDKSQITISKGIHLSSGWERILDVDEPKSRRRKGADQTSQGDGKRGFCIRAWIPVPVSLFANKETCTFRVEARVRIEDPAKRFGRHGLRWDVGSFDEELVCTGRILSASAEVTVSHLHRTREMV